MLLDLEAGRPTEVDFINGAIPREGAPVGVAAPYNEMVSALVRALERGTIRSVLEQLRVELRADRVTLRRDVPGGYAFPVTEEVLGPGAGSLREERTVDLRTQPVVALVQRGEQVVQDDTRAAFDEPAFHRMLDAYGGLAAQIVTPIFLDGSLSAIVSLHVLGDPRAWSADDAAACRQAAERVRSLL
jgi:GAF domain-containing protein